jgi:hypothetical protein
MSNLLESISNFVLERSAEELIVGVFLALVLAMASAGLHALARSKVKDNVMLLTVIGLVANLVAMLLTAGYVRMNQDPGRGGRASTPMVARQRSNPALGRDISLEAATLTIFESSDTDGDGQLSADEAAAASALFVKKAEFEAGKPLDRAALGQSIQHRLALFDIRHQGMWPAHGPGVRGEARRPEAGRSPAPPPAIPPGS